MTKLDVIVTKTLLVLPALCIKGCFSQNLDINLNHFISLKKKKKPTFDNFEMVDF